MKITSIFLASSMALAQVAAAAQAVAPAKPHVAPHTAAAHAATAEHGCINLPPLSPKIPALPPGTPCAKAMYTLTTIPPVKTSDAPPALAASVREYLGIDPVSFSLAYIDTKIGTGELAAPHKWYKVLYTGYLQDGSIFDSSAKHPEQGPFVLQQGSHGVIPGWDTGFYGMRVGGKRRLFIPHQLAYGPRQMGTIPPNADLVFDIELVSQSEKDPTPAPTAPPAAATPKTPAPAAQPAPATAPSAAAPAPGGQPAPTTAAPAATPPKPQ